jgi:hypothetical protein
MIFEALWLPYAGSFFCRQTDRCRTGGLKRRFTANIAFAVLCCVLVITGHTKYPSHLTHSENWVQSYGEHLRCLHLFTPCAENYLRMFTYSSTITLSLLSSCYVFWHYCHIQGADTYITKLS